MSAKGTMHPKTKQFADQLLAKPKLSQRKAYQLVHPDASNVTAKVNASKLLKQPSVQIYMQTHVNRAKETIVKLMESDKDEVRLRAADSILDREFGKPLTRTNTVTTTVSIEDLLNSLQ